MSMQASIRLLNPFLPHFPFATMTPHAMCGNNNNGGLKLYCLLCVQLFSIIQLLSGAKAYICIHVCIFIESALHGC